MNMNAKTRTVRKARWLLTAATAAISITGTAQAACVVEGDTTTCTGDNSEGISTTTSTVVIRDLAADIDPAPGRPAVYSPNATDVEIDAGDYTLHGDGVPAIAAFGNGAALSLSFSGTIESIGANSAQGGTSGINANAAANGGADVSVESIGDITVQASRDPAVSGFGNIGISAAGGTNGVASIASTGDISVSVTGTPSAVFGLSASGGAGASVVNAGDVSIAGNAGRGTAIAAVSQADTTIDSVGDISAEMGDGVGYGISANGNHNSITSQGDIVAEDGGIFATGAFQYDQNGAFAGVGVAAATELVSTGNVETTADGAPAIAALGEEVSVESTGTVTTSGDYSGGILAMRNYSFDRSAQQPSFDYNAQSVSVSSEGDITTSGLASEGILAGADAGSAIVVSVGDIATTGDHSGAIHADGRNASIDSTGAIATTGDADGAFGAGAGALYAFSRNGDAATDEASIVSNGNVSAQGANAGGLFAAAINTTGGTAAFARISSTGDVSTSGAAANGLWALSQGVGAEIVSSGNVTTAKDNSNAILASSSGDTNVASIGDIGTAGANSSGIIGIGVDVSVQSTGNITASGGSNGIFVTGSGSFVNGRPVDQVQAQTASVASQGDILSSKTGIFVAAQEASVLNDGTVVTSGPLGSAIFVQSDGEVSVISDAVAVTGEGADPGANANGYRIAQGGIIVEGNAGSIAIESGAVEVAGEHRYGISATGSGTISISADSVALASADSAAIAARGGAGDIAITTGSITTTGASGAGVVATSSSGNIAILAGTTKVENAGLAGPFTGDAIAAFSDTGEISVVSDNAVSAGEQGSAIYAASDGAVSVTSNVARTTGDDGLAVVAYSGAADATVEAQETTTAGDGTTAVFALSDGGDARAEVAIVTATGAASDGVYAGAQAGVASIATSGNVSVTDGFGLLAEGRDVAITTGAGTTTQVAAGHGAIIARAQNDATIVNNGNVQGTIDSFSSAGQSTIRNNGSIVVGGDNAGPAILVSGQGSIVNDGLIASDSAFGTVRFGASDDSFTMLAGSQVEGVVDMGGGQDAAYAIFAEGQTGVGQIAQFVNAETLTVGSGDWRAETGHSYFDEITIAQGARLTVAQVDEYISLAAPLINLDGRLDLDLTSDTEAGELTGLVLTGEGSVHLVGAATLLFDDTSGLSYTGGTFVENGELLLTDEFAGDITTSGDGVFELAEGGDFTGNLVNNGTFVFSQAGDYDFLGDFSGDGLLEKYGAGKLTFAGLYAFEGTTSVFGGSVAFTGQLAEDSELQLVEGAVDLSQVSGGQQTVGGLSGSGGSLVLGTTQLSIDQSANSVFAGSIEGSGSLIKQGSGDLKLNGDGTGFTGTGQVEGGTLSVNGNFSNADFVVTSDGTLGGAGTVGDTQVTGGTLAPGNSIDTLHVAGNLVYSASSVFEVEVDAAGNSDLVAATGTATLGNASVNVLAQAGTYRPLTDYTILTADGGVSGKFGSVSSNFAFLDPSLSYSANAVTLRLERNDIDFSAFAGTANEIAIANLLESLGYGDALYDETLMLADTDAAPSFASLTGDVYPSYGSLLIETAEILRRQTGTAIPADGGAFVWGTALLNHVGNGPVEGGGASLAGGVGFAASNFTASIGVGTSGQGNSGEISEGDTTFAIGRIAYGGGAGLALEAGVQMGWSDASFARNTTLGGLGGKVFGKSDADYLQLFGELGFQLPLGNVAVEPFIGVSHVSLDLEQLAESGAPTALSIQSSEREVTFGTLGFRLSGATDSAMRPFGSAAYRRAWGDREAIALVGFGSGGTAAISGAAIAKDAVEVDAGMAFTTGKLGIEVGYSGTFSGQFDSHGAKIALQLGF